MSSNLDRYKKDLDSLLATGDRLSLAMMVECASDDMKSALEKEYGDKAKDIVKALPAFKDAYQPWYSEAKVLVKQLLPDRLSDFTRHYERLKARKSLTFETYRIEDYLQGLQVTNAWDEKIVGPDAARPHFRQQLAMLKSVRARFESSLFDIRQVVQADLFDSELEAAKELARSGFTRAAGALAGVVLERHLAQACNNHDIKVAKKAPGISDLNNALKAGNAIDVPQWRFVQHLADIRNLCDHDKKTEPTEDQVSDLIAGAMKVTKTLL